MRITPNYSTKKKNYRYIYIFEFFVYFNKQLVLLGVSSFLNTF